MECSIGTLVDEACASGFKCLDEAQYRALVLQLLCNLGAGPILTAPDGSQWRLIVDNGGTLATEAVT
jgi:hypothetical protein